MKAGHFDAVKVLFGRKLGTITVVTSVRQAAEILMDPKWPVELTGTQRRARQACLDAYGGRVTGDVAREAFIAAVEEAGRLVD